MPIQFYHEVDLFPHSQSSFLSLSLLQQAGKLEDVEQQNSSYSDNLKSIVFFFLDKIIKLEQLN